MPKLFLLLELCMPLVIDLLDNKELLETCMDNAAGLSPVGETAGTWEEAGLSFSPQEHLTERMELSVEDSSLKLKHLEAEVSPVPISHSNINNNINKQ
ncbi:hypothetical protein lerEdw1_003449, partial [Lerista edwardsae]